MYWPTAVFFLFFASTCFAAAPTGIPRELARERAQMISALRYHLFFRLVPHASSTVGREELAFKLKSATPLLVDYREGTVSKVEVNSDTVPVQQQNGHILLPAEKLRAGENRVIFEFESPVAPAGKAITRYEDKDDGSEYVYTLFVPMDASMAFPCFDQPDIKGQFALRVSVPNAWTVISNTNYVAVGSGSGAAFEFNETRPISTY